MNNTVKKAVRNFERFFGSVLIFALGYFLYNDIPNKFTFLALILLGINVEFWLLFSIGYLIFILRKDS